MPKADFTVGDKTYHLFIHSMSWKEKGVQTAVLDERDKYVQFLILDWNFFPLFTQIL